MKRDYDQLDLLPSRAPEVVVRCAHHAVKKAFVFRMITHQDGDRDRPFTATQQQRSCQHSLANHGTRGAKSGQFSANGSLYASSGQQRKRFISNAMLEVFTSSAITLAMLRVERQLTFAIDCLQPLT